MSKINLTTGQIPVQIVAPLAVQAYPAAFADRGYEGITQRLEQQDAYEAVERVLLVLRTKSVAELREMGLKVQ
jgi:hypothetical protein